MSVIMTHQQRFHLNRNSSVSVPSTLPLVLKHWQHLYEALSWYRLHHALVVPLGEMLLVRPGHWKDADFGVGTNKL